MARKMDVELTSRRDDDTWTWRAAGAKLPKGVVPASLVPPGVSVGDELVAETEQDVDGITIVALHPPRGKRPGPATIEVRPPAPPPPPPAEGEGDRGSRRRSDQRGPGRRARADRGDRGPRPEGPRRERSGPEGTGGPEARGHREGGRPREGGGDTGGRRRPARPRPPKLRPARVHRDRLLEELTDEQRPIAEELMRGGMPAVRRAIEEQNAKARAEGRPEQPAERIEEIAVELQPRVALAEWRDKVDAALAGVDTVDLRDLRPVVVAGADLARDPEDRDRLEELQRRLNERIERELRAWREELDRLIAEGGVVRALRVAGRPPKAGEPLPKPVADRLAQMAAEALGPGEPPARLAIVAEALAHSPVRARVAMPSVPQDPPAELVEVVRRYAKRIPLIAAQLGVTAGARADRVPATDPTGGSDRS